MRQLTIKMKITLWLAALMALLAVAVLGFMVVISGSLASGNAQSTLVSTVDDNRDEVEYDDGQLDVDDDFVYSNQGVSVVVYSDDLILQAGHLPTGFEAQVALEDGLVRTVESNGQHYYVYDRTIPSNLGPTLWVRGIVEADASTGIVGMITTATFILVPFIVVAAALGAYLIARRSLKPIETIAQTANEIGAGTDLSMRIGMEEGKNEVSQLAQTFDRMFARLEESFEEEKRFTADVSHELRTPTAVILSQCEYALEHASTEEEYQEALETIAGQSKRMTRLISQLLAFTRLEQGMETAQFEETDISELVQITCDEQVLAHEEDRALHTTIESSILAEVDPSLIVQMVANLINNAYQYGKEGGNIWVSLKQEDGRAYLVVADDGIGIPQEHLDRLCMRFYQVETSRTASIAGSMGLGLAFVKTIVGLHGGSLHIESSPKWGSRFTVVLPTVNR